MERVKILPSVFLVLYDEVLRRYRERILEKGYQSIWAIGPELFGFRAFDEIENSIKAIMASDDEVKSYVKKSLKISENQVFKRINGKYLYDRVKEAERGNKNVQITGIYARIYFIFCECENIKDFLEKNKAITERDKRKQYLLLSNSRSYASEFSSRFIAQYFSYRENKIKRFVLEIDYLDEIKVKQTGFHFAIDEEYSENKDSWEIDVGKVYKGNGIEKESYLYLYLQGGKGNFMNIFLYIGGMSIQGMKLVRGTLTAMSAHGYIFSAEVFLKRVSNEKIPSIELLIDYTDKYEDETDLFIKRYLYLERRTLRIPRNTEQNINKLSAKRYSLKVIDSLIGIWKIWGVDSSNNVMQSKLIINEDYSSYLFTYSDQPKEKQVCIFRVSTLNGLNLWISAHQEHGIELKNIAVIRIPDKSDEVQDITAGVSSGLGKNRYANTPIVLYKINNDNFHPTQLDREDLMTVMFSFEEDAYKHQKMYMNLEELVPKLDKENNNFIPYLDLFNARNSSVENLGDE